MNRDVVVIGAGPAGSAAALLLARRGWQVTLIEQHRFPRGKVCGECLSALGIESLARMGLERALRELRPAILSHAAIHSGNSKAVYLKLPAPMWGISRDVLDTFLLNSAREAGATIVQPARCERIGPNTHVRVRLLESNEFRTLCPTWVIVADGKGALLLNPPSPTDDFGIKTHFENVDGPSNTIELFGCSGLYGGLAPIENGRWNAAFSVPAERLRRHRGNVQAVFDEIVDESRVLRDRLAKAHRVGQWLAAPLPRFPVTLDGMGNVVPVGNAAAALEPIGGEGMGLGLRSAELAVEAITCGRPNIARSLMSAYRQLWRYRRPFCRLSGAVISRPALAAAALPIVRTLPFAPFAALRLIGKSRPHRNLLPQAIRS
jgi:flavin-dependent dehydrogenase